MLSWLVVLVALLSFLRGFFPQKNVLPGYNTQVAAIEPKYSKLVFMVVDALRSDMMFDTKANMPNVQQFIRDGHALPFTGYSNPPTVTLPRLKGLTTGGAPSFLDAVLNIAESTSSSPLGDSWVHQLAMNNKTIHMYGDDTWHKLFPGIFAHTDGTSSFFVNDYTEVDNNVTRHVEPNLNSKDWDVLILHYLGLDHIGHKGGPNSPLMPHKQAEMDGIVKKLYEGIDDDTIIIVTGDHGMNEVGNHGGSSAGETSAALLFLAKHKLSEGLESPTSGENYNYYRQIPQIDIAPTITMLLGLPVPQNSLGLPISDLVDDRDYMCAHFSRLLRQDFVCNSENLLDLQQQYMRVSTEYNQPLMLVGIGIMLAGVLLSLYGLIRSDLSWRAISTSLVVTGLCGVSMFGSSTIEEEHQFWYWAFTGFSTYCIVLHIGSTWRWVIVLAAFRFIRGWHNAGQKWIGPESYSVSSSLHDHPYVLWGLTFFTYFLQVLRFQDEFVGLFALFFSVAFKVCAASLAGFEIPFFSEDIAMIATVYTPYFYRGMLVWLFIRTLLRKYEFKPALELLLITQSRLVDIPMFLFYFTIEKVIPQRLFAGNEWAGAILTLLLENASFYAAGGSNSLATVDLSNAYNGITSYNIPLVSLLTFVSNWAGPIFWAINGPRRGGCWHTINTVYYSVIGLCIILACYILQDHLFVWTVFSPKLLYLGAWIVFNGLESLLCTR